jgi:hypothetical protein
MYKVIELATGFITSYDVYGEALEFISTHAGYIMI